MRYQGAQRFVNKNTRNSRRLRYLHGIFPDAYFVHVLRDPRAVVASLMKVDFWPDMALWWHEDKTPRQLVAAGAAEAELAATHAGVRSVERLLADKDALDPARYLELRYEDFVADPEGALGTIFAFAGLARCVRVPAQLVRNQNDKYRSRLSPEELETVGRIAGPLAERVGYDLHPAS